MFRKIGVILCAAGVLLFARKVPACAADTGMYYHISITKMDGNYGYHRTVPHISVENKKQGSCVKYYLKGPNQKVIRGKVDNMQEKKTVLNGKGSDGRYVLDVWSEDSHGNIIAESATSKIIMVDSKTEKQAVTFSWNQKKRMLEISGQDYNSGVDKIVYRVGDEKEQTVKGEKAFVKIPNGFQGKVSACILDRAGNKSKKETYQISERKKPKKQAVKQAVKQPVKQAEKESEKPILRVMGVWDYMITNQPVTLQCATEHGDLHVSVTGKMTWESPGGEKKKQVLEDLTSPIAFAEEGIYHISIDMQDHGKIISTQELQFIIDCIAPLVRYEEELVVRDFTSYTCETTSDGFLVVTDAAGNQSTKNLELMWKTASHKSYLEPSNRISPNIIGGVVLFLVGMCVKLLRRRVRV